jgi:tetratricopeptide (TPR) repeat protein
LNAGHPCAARKLDWLIYLRALTAMGEEYGCGVEELRLLGKAGWAGSACQTDNPTRERFREFRAAGNELYIRLHILGDESLFARLEAQGWVEHHIPEVTDEAIQRAICEPPAGRAANRAALIMKYAGRDGISASWDKLIDATTRTLTIPSAAAWNGEEKWQPAPPPAADARVATATALFRVGKYHETIKALAGTDPADFGFEAWDVAELLCLSFARLGMKPETLQARTHLARFAAHRFQELAIFLSATNNLGLSSPLQDMLPIIRAGEETLPHSGEDDYFLFSFNQYKARMLSLQGNLAQAGWMFRTILALPENRYRTRMMARTRCFHAETLRLMGRHEEAVRELGLATERHLAENMVGDLADHSLLMRAKLGPDEEAREALKQAENLQRALGNELGLARVLCLKARRLKIGTDYNEFWKLQRRVTALQDCPVAARVVAEWDSWIKGSEGHGPTDYWGV